MKSGFLEAAVEAQVPAMRARIAKQISAAFCVTEEMLGESSGACAAAQQQHMTHVVAAMQAEFERQLGLGADPYAALPDPASTALRRKVRAVREARAWVGVVLVGIS